MRAALVVHVHPSHRHLHAHFVVHRVKGQTLQGDHLPGGKGNYIQEHIYPLTRSEECLLHPMGSIQQTARPNKPEGLGLVFRLFEKSQPEDPRIRSIEEAEAIEPGGYFQDGIEREVREDRCAFHSHRLALSISGIADLALRIKKLVLQEQRDICFAKSEVQGASEPTLLLILHKQESRQTTID